MSYPEATRRDIMRPIWSGSISFGLVNIPVRLFSGSVTHEGLDLHMLHKEDMGRIRYARICRKDGKEIPYDEIVRGYEYQEGDYIVLNAEDFKKADVRHAESIEIRQFVDEREIDSRYFEKPYYLEPGKGAARAYALLRDALAESGKVGLAKYALRARDNMAAVKPYGQSLILNQLRFPADLREPSGLNFPDKNKEAKEEMDMALALIKQQTKPFIPEDWHDTYTEAIEGIIEEKAKGKVPTAKGEQPVTTRVTDLMETLKASLNN